MLFELPLVLGVHEVQLVLELSDLVVQVPDHVRLVLHCTGARPMQAAVLEIVDIAEVSALADLVKLLSEVLLSSLVVAFQFVLLDLHVLDLSGQLVQSGLLSRTSVLSRAEAA